MNIWRTSNPSLWDKVFTDAIGTGHGEMTLQGTINKSFLLIALVIAGAAMTWNYAAVLMPFYYPLLIGTFIFALIIIFKKTWAPFLAPLYALAEWVFIGLISFYFESAFPGIVMQAAGITFAIFGALLLTYKTGLIKATENFKLGVAAATGGILLVYIVSLVGTLTGWFSVPYIHESGPIGIGVSVFIVLIASLNLVLDFDFIENGVEAKAPKYMEWYASFGLLITLVWLYIEILRLLSKLQQR